MWQPEMEAPPRERQRPRRPACEGALLHVDPGRRHGGRTARVQPSSPRSSRSLHRRRGRSRLAGGGGTDGYAPCVVRTEKAVRPRSVCHLLMSWATVMALEDAFVRRDQFKDHAVDRQAQTRSRNAAFNPVAFYRSLAFNAAEPRVQVVDRQLGGRLDLIPPQAGLVAVPQHDL